MLVSVEIPAVETLEHPVNLEPITTKELSVNEIMDIIPHRYPFLMVERVIDHEPGKYMLGYKNVSMNEAYFPGHFPGNPILPGVLQIEALAQLGAVLVSCMPQGRGKLGIFLGVDGVRFRRIVKPGDRLDMRVELLKLKGPVGKFKGTAWVDGELTLEAEILFSITERKPVEN